MTRNLKKRNAFSALAGLLLVLVIIIVTVALMPHSNKSDVSKKEEPVSNRQIPSGQNNSGTIPTLTLLNAATAQENKAIVKNALTTLAQVQEIQKGKNIKPTDMSSDGLARYFNEQMNCQGAGNKLLCINGFEYIFTGDGSCTTADGCNVIIDTNGEKAPNEEWTDYEKPKDRVTVPIKFEHGNLVFEIPAIAE